jgi:hypothetical protein
MWAVVVDGFGIIIHFINELCHTVDLLLSTESESRERGDNNFTIAAFLRVLWDEDVLMLKLSERVQQKPSTRHPLQ